MAVEIDADGIRVEHLPAADGRGVERPPLVFVHGGLHGSWCWERLMPYLADRGWDGYALNWQNHNGSRQLPENEFIRRGLADVVDDVVKVVDEIGRSPILVAHSMGGLVAQKYAERSDPEGLALLAPCFPTQTGAGEEIDLPLEMDEPWGPPPPEVARELFFQGCDDEEVARYSSLLCPESPRCVHEVTRGWLVPVDNREVDCPVLILGADEDRLCPFTGFRRTADYYGAECHLYEGRGHNLILDDRWEDTGRDVAAWLESTFRGNDDGRGAGLSGSEVGVESEQTS